MIKEHRGVSMSSGHVYEDEEHRALASTAFALIRLTPPMAYYDAPDPEPITQKSDERPRPRSSGQYGDMFGFQLLCPCLPISI